MSYRLFRLWTFTENKREIFRVCTEFGHYKVMEIILDQLFSKNSNVIIGRFDLKRYDEGGYEIKVRTLPKDMRKVNSNQVFKYLPNLSHKVRWKYKKHYATR